MKRKDDPEQRMKCEAERVRPLDFEIAEKVMGWKRGQKYGNGNGDWILPDGRTHGYTWDTTPRFSTKLDAAWLVVECLAAMGHGLVLEQWLRNQGVRNGWVALFDLADGHDTGQHLEETAPLAICRAALAAVKAA